MSPNTPEKKYTAKVEPDQHQEALEHVESTGAQVMEKHRRTGLLTFRATDSQLKAIVMLPTLGQPQEF